jgi:hypothetical protein
MNHPWQDADMEQNDLERLYPKPYPHEAILHPRPNVSELPEVVNIIVK